MTEQSRWLNQLRLRPQAVDIHFDLGLRAYEMSDAYVLARHRGALGLLPEAGVTSQPFLALRWRELWLDGARLEAIQVALSAYESDPSNVDIAIDLSTLLDEVDRKPESLKILLECARLNLEEPDIWHQVGIASDQSDDLALRRQAFQRVWELERNQEPEGRYWVPEDILLECVEKAIHQLPPVVDSGLGRITYVFEDYPDAWILDTELGDPRVSVALEPCEEEEANAETSRLIFFRWNIERLGGSEEDVQSQLTAAVRDEIAFALGIDDGVLHFVGEG